MELPEWDIDRQAIEGSLVAKMTAGFQQQVATGEWTQGQADQAVGALTRSKALQEAVDAEVQHLEAFLSGRIH
ncbi:hypothetical protein H010_00565 [Hydrogenophaga taeniospiralis CCUG 15921]|uniref:Uncharacterized protein n=1 Tax=Hydrogenophaga taeniospiralis CCUG 15921 TaxID=1281780 RepID=A0A9X4NM60_9BURK|nr:hypothetical protein [Hydrogenophaga taeniospiralis]MDG5973720.1 hypothetical protein [Hydrogenophaga taeniospiralis CCUG 15921]